MQLHVLTEVRDSSSISTLGSYLPCADAGAIAAAIVVTLILVGILGAIIGVLVYVYFR